MLKVGVLGLGMMGGFHAKRYLNVPGAELVAVADATPARLEAKEAVAGNIADEGKEVDLATLARYDDASALIAEADVDVVDVCLPTYLHARYAVQALEAGKHVICEKPMALTVQEANRMVDAAQQADRKLMIAQCIRFWPEYRFLRQCARDGRFGKLLSLNMFRMGGRPIWSWENWFLDPARSGGPIWDLHVHDVDFVNYMLGMPDWVQCVGKKTAATGAYDIVHTLYTYQDGPQVHVHAGWSVGQIPFMAGFDAWFENAVLRFDGRNDPPLQIFDDPMEVNGRPAEVEQGDAYYNEIAYFIDCVRTGSPTDECPPQSARDSLRLVDLEIQAIESGQAVSGKG